MTARILLVDDTPANLKFLEARLIAEYYDVATASNGVQAIATCARESFDLVLLDVMMPGMDGFETCRLLKAEPATAHIPVIIVTALDQPSDRVKGLQAGADDFLTKPINEMALLARVKSLVRLKTVVDELRLRALTSEALDFFDPLSQAVVDDGLGGRILLVEDRPSSAERIVSALSHHYAIDVRAAAPAALTEGAEARHDLLMVSLGLRDTDGLRLCSQLLSLERTRHVPILLLADLEDETRILRGLDLGVSDYIMRPIERNEMLARVRTQMRRKRYSDRLRMTLRASMELAITDQLTGLHNRRYLEMHLPRLLQDAVRRRSSLSLMILDIDHFKAVNDTYGHDAGDTVLQIFASRVRSAVRDADILCRLGGEEFIVVMPDLPPNLGALVAERVRLAVGALPFTLPATNQALSITVSIGLAGRCDEANGTAIMKRADAALYRSKTGGRNRVCADAA